MPTKKRKLVILIAGIIIIVAIIAGLWLYFYINKDTPEVKKSIKMVEKIQNMGSYTIVTTDNDTKNYRLQNRNGVSVTQLGTGGIMISLPSTKAYVVADGRLLESTDAGAHRVASSLFRAAKKCSGTVICTPLTDEGVDDLTVNVVTYTGMANIRKALGYVSESFADDQCFIIENRLKIALDDTVSIALSLVTDYKTICYIELKYTVGSETYSVMRVDGYLEAPNWELDFDWGKLDISSLTDEELFTYIEKTVNAVDEVAIALFAENEIDSGNDINENTEK